MRPPGVRAAVRRLSRIVVGVVAAAAVAVALVFTGWVVGERSRDPLEAVDLDPGAIRVVRDTARPATTAAGERRIYRELRFESTGLGAVEITVSRPTDADGPYPLLVLLAGFRTGGESLRHVPAHGPNLVVGYEYPYTPERWARRSGPLEVPALREAILRVPGQVALVRRLVSDLEDVDGRRTSLLGYSFGALFTPAALRVARRRGVPFRGGILAYAGTDIRRLLEANLDVDPGLLRRAVAGIAAAAIRPLEPALHLPHLEGRFLAIRGARDERIPRESSERLADLLPEPKRIVRLEAGHMGPENPEVTRRVVELSREWLLAEDLMAPPRAPGSSGADGLILSGDAEPPESTSSPEPP